MADQDTPERRIIRTAQAISLGVDDDGSDYLTTKAAECYLRKPTTYIWPNKVYVPPHYPRKR